MVFYQAAKQRGMHLPLSPTVINPLLASLSKSFIWQRKSFICQLKSFICQLKSFIGQPCLTHVDEAVDNIFMQYAVMSFIRKVNLKIASAKYIYSQYFCSHNQSSELKENKCKLSKCRSYVQHNVYKGCEYAHTFSQFETIFLSKFEVTL